MHNDHTPGLDALYEVTSSLPVVGPGEASMHFACMLGRPFGIITVADGTAYPVPRKVAAGSRLSSLLAGPTA